MIVYLIMIIISLLFSYLAMKFKDNKFKFFIFAFLSATTFFLISTLRYDVGTDYMSRYVRDYNIFAAGGKILDLEIGFIMIDYIAAFFHNYLFIFLITSLLICYIMLYSIFKYSKNPVLSILLFFISTFFFLSLNMIRQFISMVFIVWGFNIYKTEKKYLLPLILFFIACLFHSISFIFLLFVVLDYLFNKFNIEINKKIILSFFLFIIAIFILKPYLINIITFILEKTRFRSYINSKYFVSDLQIIPFFINNIVLFVMLYCYSKKEQINADNNLLKSYLILQMFGIIFIALGYVSLLCIRISYFFTIFSIISIPNFLDIIKNKNMKIKKMITLGLIIIYSVALVWTHVLHNSDEILPYKFIFNHEMIIR